MNPEPDRLGAALALMRQGQTAQAELACRDILTTEPDNFGARHLLGVTLLMRGDALGAEQQIARAIALNPGVAGAYYNRGNALLALDRLQEAIASYDAGLKLKPDMAEALCNRGNALSRLRRYDAAIASFEAALALRPAIIEAHNNLGEVLLKLGRHAEALARFDDALARDPGHAAALNNRGTALYELGRFEEALASYERAIAVVPQAAPPHDNRGLVLQELGRYEEAIESHDKAIALDPQFAAAYLRRAMAKRMFGRFDEALQDSTRAVALQPKSARSQNGHGIVLNDMGRYDEALVAYRTSIALDPGFAEAHNNLGNVLYDMGRMEEALAALEQAIALKPGFSEAYSNRGLVLQDTRHFDEAGEAYDLAIASKPHYAEAYKRRATLRLLQGDFRNGWTDYETSLRHARRHSSGPLPHIPFWEGQPLQGKSILLSEPNGLGDTIQYWRFIPVLMEMGAQVAFMGPARMFRLLRGSPWQARLLSELPADQSFDYRSDLWGLPSLLGTVLDTIPGGIPYLQADQEAVAKWSALLEPGRFNIGISWQGNPGRKIDAGRSIPLAAFQPLGQVPGVRLISLQRNHGLEQLAQLPEGMNVVDPDADFDAGPDAFIDTAGLMAGLDLVVSSDTAIVHLAGALGRPTWLGVKWVPEWRWLLDRRDSPWYPTLRLFRQPSPGDWDGVFAQMAEELAELLQARAGRGN